MRNVLLITLSLISMVSEASQECMVLSNGSEMSIAQYKGGALHIEHTLVDDPKLINPVWPSFSESLGILFFEANENGRSGIYQSSALSRFKSISFLMPGKYPALSPSGNKIAYFNGKNNLAVRDMDSGHEIVIGDAYKLLSVWKRPLWLNNSEIIYTSESGEVFIFNYELRSYSKLSIEKLFPLASREGVVIFTDSDAKTLYEYRSGELKTVLRHRSLSMAPGMIILKGGIIFSRQTWSKIIRFSEAKSIFYFSQDHDSEKVLVENYSLFGAALVPCNLQWTSAD